MQGLRESVAAAVELHFNADSISARIRESNLHWLKQAQISKELHKKRETYHEEKFKTFETRNNRRFKGAEQQTQFFKGRLEEVTKERDTKGEELGDVKNRLAETKEALENTSRDKEVLKGELGALKTLLEKERNVHKSKLAQLQKSLQFEQAKSRLLDQGLKAKEALEKERQDQVSDVTRLKGELKDLEGELKEAQEAIRVHDNTFSNDSKRIYTAATLVAGATEETAGKQLGEGKKLLCSVENGVVERKSKSSRYRANKKRRKDEERLEMEKRSRDEERLEMGMTAGHNRMSPTIFYGHKRRKDEERLEHLLAGEESAGRDPAVTL
jgi:hypothetical protein